MAPDNAIPCRMGTRQWRLGRILDKNGHTLKAISAHSGIPYNTLRSYFPADEHLVPCIMPITALVDLFGVIPDVWLSLLTEPEGRCFASTTDGEGALSELQDVRAKLDVAIEKVKSKLGASA